MTTISEFTHHDLRSGWSGPVSVPADHKLARPVASAITGAHEGRGLVPVTGTSFQLFADYTTAREGNAYFFIATTDHRSDGHVKMDDVLYTAVVACRLATAPLAWRHIMKHYVPIVASTTASTHCHAPGLMPHSVPWLIGFMSPTGDHLTREERLNLQTVLRVAGNELLNRCDQFAPKQKLGLSRVHYPELEE